MTGSAKRKALILLGLVAVISMIIAAGLPQLQFQPGMPLPRLENAEVVSQATAAQPRMAISVGQFFSAFFAVILTGVLVYTLYQLLRGAHWKEILKYVRLIAVISLSVGGLIFLILLLPKAGGSSSIPPEMPIPTPVPLVTAPLGPLPPTLLWLVGIGLLVAGILVLVWILTATSRQVKPIHLVGSEAEKAWQALQTGLALKDVIIKCYRQMSLALQDEQGIKRSDFMTTGEFERLLEAAGIPHEPIHQLTRLFEAVRYGNWQPNPADEQKAIQCLEAIMLYSRETRGNELK